MKLVDRYILKAHLGPFLFAFITLLFVLILQFFTTFADRFIGKGIGFGAIAELMLLQSAWMVGLAAPMATLVAVVMAFGSLTTTSEMTVFRASGISLYRLMLPVLCAGLLLSFVVERFNNMVLPRANFRAKAMMADIALSKPAFGLTEGAFSTLIDGYSIFVRKVDERTKELQGIVIYDHTNPEYRTVATAEKGNVALSADAEYLLLTLHRGEIHQVSRADGKRYRTMSFEKHRVVAPSGFGALRSAEQRVRTDENELSAEELRLVANEFRTKILAAEQPLQAPSDSLNPVVAQNPSRGTGTTVVSSHPQKKVVATSGDLQAQRAERDGALKSLEDSKSMYNKYMAAYHKKYALSLACFVFVMVGAPLGVLARRGGFGVGASLSLLLFILYWMLMITGEKVAQQGLLDPMLAIWSANMIVLGIGIALMVSLSGSVFNTSR